MQYWEEKGKHSKMLQAIWDKHVPAQGESSDPIGEVVRCFSRFVYECGNNGNCNLYEEERVEDYGGYWDDEEYEEEEEWELTDMRDHWQEMFDTIAKFVDNDSLMVDFEQECRMIAENYGGRIPWDRITIQTQLGDLIGDIILEKYPEYNLQNKEESV